MQASVINTLWRLFRALQQNTEVELRRAGEGRGLGVWGSGCWDGGHVEGCGVWGMLKDVGCGMNGTRRGPERSGAVGAEHGGRWAWSDAGRCTRGTPYSERIWKGVGSAGVPVWVGMSVGQSHVHGRAGPTCVDGARLGERVA